MKVVDLVFLTNFAHPLTTTSVSMYVSKSAAKTRFNTLVAPAVCKIAVCRSTNHILKTAGPFSEDMERVNGRYANILAKLSPITCLGHCALSLVAYRSLLKRLYNNRFLRAFHDRF